MLPNPDGARDSHGHRPTEPGAFADRIVVMDSGRVRATGTHEELLARDALYRKLAATQLLLPKPDGFTNPGSM